MATLRLLKVIVQPVFVLDDGESLTEVVAQPMPVSGEAWPTYATTGFAEAFKQLQAEYEAAAPKPAPPKPNRAARRHPPKGTATAP